MTQIQFDAVAHSYGGSPQSSDDYALQRMDFTWDDGGAYALLGPSGCGKSTLLNICSGLLTPSEGRIYFDGQDVSAMSPEERNIAQVFQFPVLYDSMTVFDNLAFPLRNRKENKAHIAERVRAVAEMLDLEHVLKKRASNLGAELKQKISMGRGLVRQDTTAILFDEPLTVIDPQEKWKLRRKLKEIHAEFNKTLIYVTHDQTEALTFADKVVVMSEGEMVQVGTPQELFERPEHTFVGYFIGSPGMNFLPCTIASGAASIGDQRIELSPEVADAAAQHEAKDLQLGIRPEFVELVPEDEGTPVTIDRVVPMGQFRIVTAQLAGHEVKARVPNDAISVDATRAGFRFPPEWSCLYADNRLVTKQSERSNG
ncbi:ABC transporter ATP-binding protein [Salinisphaera sp. USBA-960]|nr:ABC transporter ATP-binding protein [Salifodinibacter halophilus]NNC26853.1 ABC transporter ATP-binding protein [Salifodinibacter halophilus]